MDVSVSLTGHDTAYCGRAVATRAYSRVTRTDRRIPTVGDEHTMRLPAIIAAATILALPGCSDNQAAEAGPEPAAVDRPAATEPDSGDGLTETDSPTVPAGTPFEQPRTMQNGPTTFQVTVTGAPECGVAIESSEGPATPDLGQFCTIGVSATNTGPTPAGVWTFDLGLIDREGRRFSPEGSAYIYTAGGEDVFTEPLLQPTETGEFALLFDVPAEAVWAGLAWGDDQGGRTIVTF